MRPSPATVHTRRLALGKRHYAPRCFGGIRVIRGEQICGAYGAAGVVAIFNRQPWVLVPLFAIIPGTPPPQPRHTSEPGHYGHPKAGAWKAPLHSFRTCD